MTTIAELLRGDDGAVAHAVWTLASASHTRRLELAMNERVVQRLVAILSKDEVLVKEEAPPTPNATQAEWRSPSEATTLVAVMALVDLARGSPACRVAVATALTREAIVRLVDQHDTALLPELTVDNPTFTTRLASVRGVSHYQRLIEQAANDSVLQNGVYTLCLLAQDSEDGAQRREAFRVLTTMAHGGDGSDRVLNAVASWVHLDIAHRVLLESRLDTDDLIETLRASRRRGACGGRSRCAALSLAAYRLDDDVVVADMDKSSVALALIDALEIEVRFHRRTQARRWPAASEHVVRCVADALAKLTASEPLVCLEMKASGGLATLVTLACDDSASAPIAMQLLEKFFLADAETRAMVSVTGGLQFLVHHLRDGVIDARKTTTLDILASVLSGDAETRQELLMRVVDLGGVTQLVRLSEQAETTTVVRAKAASVLQSLPELLPRLLARGDFEALKTLEIMAKHRVNQHTLVMQDAAIPILIKLLKKAARSPDEIQAAALRVLGQLAQHETGQHQLLVHVDRLIKLLSRSHEPLVHASVTTLSKLVRSHIGRTTISHAIPRLVEILQSRDSIRLREDSTRLLSEVVRDFPLADRQLVVTSRAITVLLDVARDHTSTWKLLQAVVASLYGIARHDIEFQQLLIRVGAVGVLEETLQRLPLYPIAAAERLLLILSP